MSHELSSFALGQGDDETYLPGCSWQKPFPTPERKKVDGHSKTDGKLQPPHSGLADAMGPTEMAIGMVVGAAFGGAMGVVAVFT